MKVVRPRDLSEDRRNEIGRYLSEQWDRAVSARADQVDRDYKLWNDIYTGKPAEKERTWPWVGASNIVVPVARMHLDTFAARSLGVIFAAKPLVNLIGYPKEYADPGQTFLNYKLLYQWAFNPFARKAMYAGNKTGTATAKIPWEYTTTLDVMPGDVADKEEKEITVYEGPRFSIVPFEDFYVYPITATEPHEIIIKFHRIRYTAEVVKELCESGRWQEAFEDLEPEFRTPDDVKRDAEQESAGIVDPLLDELQVVECHFRFNLGGNYYDLVALLLPSRRKVLDIYFTPTPRNIDIFRYYRPYQRDSLFFGESMCAILSPFQEEISKLHNERRDNATIANVVGLKVKAGTDLPEKFVPGMKVEVGAMDEFDTFQLGRNYIDTLAQENWILQLASQLTGIGPGQQSTAAMSGGKRGQYNTGGTMAMLAEGNQRQDENIRIFRDFLADCAKTGFVLNNTFLGLNDPCISYFAPKEQEAIRKMIEYATADPDRTHHCPFEIQASTAAMNKEVERQALMQMAGVVNQYYQQAFQMAQQLYNDKMPRALRNVIVENLQAMQQMGSRLARAFDEIDPNGLFPDIVSAIEAEQQQQQQPQQPATQSSGSGAGPSPTSRPGLAALSQMAIPQAAPDGDRYAAA